MIVGMQLPRMPIKTETNRFYDPDDDSAIDITVESPSSGCRSGHRRSVG